MSKAFYDRLGEQLTNEIVDWFNSVDTELKDQNSRHWEHFEATLESSMKALESRFEGNMKALESRFEGNMKALESRLEGKMNALESRLEGRMNAFESRIEGNVKALESKLLIWMFTFWVTSTLSLGGLILMTR